MKIKIIAALFTAPIAALLLSANVTANTSVTVEGKISRIYPNSGNVFFKLKNDQCGNTGKYYYFTLDSDVEKAWYAMVLAAANTDKPVSVSLPACPVATNVQVRYIYQDY